MVCGRDITVELSNCYDFMLFTASLADAFLLIMAVMVSLKHTKTKSQAVSIGPWPDNM